jgi:protoheme IX farnesyltransferase
MTPSTQSVEKLEHVAHPVLHAVPDPGMTATLIHDYRELFKVKVMALVVVTGAAGFYLGSAQSGIASLKIDFFLAFLQTLIGIGLVSAGAGALNEAMERRSDARMVRTADRPMAAGRISLPHGIIAGIGAIDA